jgi:hypothetical protein
LLTRNLCRYAQEICRIEIEATENPPKYQYAEKFKVTADRSPFLRFMGYVEDHSKLLKLFISEHGKRTLEKLS